MNFKYPLEKIVVNSSFGKLTQLPDFAQKGLPEIESSLATITGQKAQQRPSRKSIAGFKLREGVVIGLKTTLRRQKMMHFLNKVVFIVLPRVRDFRGIGLNSIDEHGNLTFGIKEHVVFPEIIAENARVNYGIEMTLVPKNEMSKEKALEFYRKLGIPFEKEAKKK
jgi:large subunit ribosomal protein L5